MPPSRPLPFDELLAERRKAIERFVEGLFDDEREYLRTLLAKPARRPTKWTAARLLQVLAEVDAALATGSSREHALQMSADTHADTHRELSITAIERKLIKAKKLAARDGERLVPPKRKTPQK
jgi:hypothetical protein